MFTANAVEALLLISWVVGLVAAVYGWQQSRDSLKGLIALLLAVAVPVLGALLAVVYALLAHRRSHLRVASRTPAESV